MAGEKHAAHGERAAAVETTATTERRQSTRLVIVLVLVGAFFFVELAGARIARSDVLEADAFHLLMDVFAIAISLVAMRVASRKPNARFTFGLRRAEPLAALTNGVLVLGVALELVRDGIEHLSQTSEPRSGVMLIVASAALLVNGINAWLLHGVLGHGHAHGHAHDHHHHGHEHEGHEHERHAHRDHGHDHDHAHEREGSAARGHQLNLRGAWLHLLGDALGSFAAFVAGLAIRLGASPIVDPIASFLVVAILVVGALRLLRDAGLVLLEAAPKHLSVAKIEAALASIDGVTRVSALHVWSLGTGHDAITAHVRASSKDPELGSKAAALLRQRFTVEYVTVQVEPD